MSLDLIHWEAPGPYRIAFTTRAGGVSPGPFASLNLGRMTLDAAQNVEENRRRLCAALGADAARLGLSRQTHSATVYRARPGRQNAPGDGLWTDEPGLPILKQAADCVPIAIARANGRRPAVGVLHAGWRGLLEGIVESGVAALGGGRLAAAVGPAIGPCCYEVGAEVSGPFRARFGAGVLRGRSLDLWESAERALRAVGVETVERVDLCTSCNPDRFFSHRRDRGLTGRQGVLGLVA